MAEPTDFPELISIKTGDDRGAAPPAIDPAADRDVIARVHELLMLLVHPVGTSDRRSERRYAYPYLVRLTPVGADVTTPVGETIVVVGKSLSEHGFGFYHQLPLAHRRVIASFHAGDNRWLGLLLDLRWCRYSGQGWYEGGGRFLQAVPAQPPKDMSAEESRALNRSS